MQPPIDSSASANLNSHAAMVLLVDDQVMVGEAIRRALATEGNIDFHYCSDPEKALTVAIQTRPTVILQDLVLPGVDGLSLVQEYRGHPVTRDIPIIVLSTKEDPAIKSAAFAAGANDYLSSCPTPLNWWRASAITRARIWRWCSATRPTRPCARASSNCWKAIWSCAG